MFAEDNEPQAEESIEKLEWIVKLDSSVFDSNLLDFIESTNVPFNSSNVEQNSLPNIPNEMTQYLRQKSTFENDIDYTTQNGNLIYQRLISE